MLIDERVMKEEGGDENPLNIPMGKTHFQALRIAVESGAVATFTLQRKLNLDYKTASEILDWLIENGFVKDDSGKDQLKTTLMDPEMFDICLRASGRSLKTKRERQRTVDDALYKASLRLAIRKQRISAKILKEAFAIGSVRAQAVMDKMCEDGFIYSSFLCDASKIFITKEKFKEMYGEEILGW